MSVTIYDETNPHPCDGGYYGIRVTRSVDGQSRQRYFPLRRDGQPLPLTEKRAVIKQAYQLDADWLEQQKLARQRRLLEAAPTSRSASHATVRGIRYCVLTDRKPGGRVYRTPVFEVSIRCPDDLVSTKRFPITKYGYAGAWRAAVRYLALCKGLVNYQHLLKRMPPQRQPLGLSINS